MNRPAAGVKETASVYEAVNELQWRSIPLLASLQGGEYALFQLVHTFIRLTVVDGDGIPC